MEIILLIHGGLLLASILLAFHCRVMHILAGMVGRSEQMIQSATLGFPFSILVFSLGSAWFVLIGRIPLISFVSCMFITLFGGIFAVGFFFANYNIGIGVWWTKSNLDAATDRYQRKVERWQARAREDRAREKRFGNSARL